MQNFSRPRVSRVGNSFPIFTNIPEKLGSPSNFSNFTTLQISLLKWYHKLNICKCLTPLVKKLAKINISPDQLSPRKGSEFGNCPDLTVRDKSHNNKKFLFFARISENLVIKTKRLGDPFPYRSSLKVTLKLPAQRSYSNSAVQSKSNAQPKHMSQLCLQTIPTTHSLTLAAGEEKVSNSRT